MSAAPPGESAFIFRLLRLDVPDDARDAALAFVVRFQQTTGPVMAKAVEDTVFYRFNRLIALNEVGGDRRRPAPAPTSSTQRWPSARSTRAARPLGNRHARHQARRGRARPALRDQRGAGGLERGGERWRGMNDRAGAARSTRPLRPSPKTEWLIYQTLLGAGPLASRPATPKAWPIAFRQQRPIPFRRRRCARWWTGAGRRRTREKHTRAAVRALQTDRALLEPGTAYFLQDFLATAEAVRGAPAAGPTAWPRACSS